MFVRLPSLSSSSSLITNGIKWGYMACSWGRVFCIPEKPCRPAHTFPRCSDESGTVSVVYVSLIIVLEHLASVTSPWPVVAPAAASVTNADRCPCLTRLRRPLGHVRRLAGCVCRGTAVAELQSMWARETRGRGHAGGRGNSLNASGPAGTRGMPTAVADGGPEAHVRVIMCSPPKTQRDSSSRAPPTQLIQRLQQQWAPKSLLQLPPRGLLGPPSPSSALGTCRVPPAVALELTGSIGGITLGIELDKRGLTNWTVRV